MYNTTRRKNAPLGFKTPIRVSCLWLVLISSALSTCSPSVPIEPTGPASTQAPTAQLQASPSATPSVNLSISPPQILNSPGTAEETLVGTILNLESFPVGEVLIHLHRNGSMNSEEPILTTAPIPSQIQPSMEALFYFKLPDNSVASDFNLSYSASPSDRDLQTDVLVEIHGQRETFEGRMQIQGEVINQGDHLLRLQSVHILLENELGTPVGLAVGEHLLPTIPPNGGTPFIASTNNYFEADSLEAYIDVSPALMPAMPPLEFGAGLKTETTGQGQTYFLGQVENQGVTPWWMVLNIIYLIEDEMLALDTLQLPFPIPPRDGVPFVLDPSRALPPDVLINGDLEYLEIQMVVDPWKSLPSIENLITIPVSITQFEQIGSKLYLTGRVTNTQAKAVSHASTFITVYDIQGRTRAVGWSEPLGNLQAGESQNFRVDMLLPKDLDLTLTEFDVRAFGFPSE